MFDATQPIPEGGASLKGHDAEGNPTSYDVPEGVVIKPVGSVSLDDNGNPQRYFASNGYWTAFPKDPLMLRDDLTIVPHDGSASVIVPLVPQE